MSACQQHPKSDGPDFWAVWLGAEPDVDWIAVTDDWQQVSAPYAVNDLGSGDSD